MGRAQITPLLSGIAAGCAGSMYGLDFRIKTMASLVRKVLEKSNGDAAAVGGVLRKQNDALRYTVLFPTESYVRGVNEVRR